MIREFMNSDYLGRRKELIPQLLLGVSVVLAVLILIKTTSFFAAAARADAVVKRATVQTKPNVEAVSECIAKSRLIADELKKSNLFSPPLPEQHPVSSVLGILGDEVLIGDKWYKAGDKVGEARIVAVEASQVRIEWHGSEKVFAPIDGTAEPASGGTRRAVRNAQYTAKNDRPSGKSAAMVQIGGDGRSPVSRKVDKEQTAAADKKAEKQRLAAEKKESGKLSKSDSKKAQISKDKVESGKKKPQKDSKETREKSSGKKPTRK